MDPEKRASLVDTTDLFAHVEASDEPVVQAVKRLAQGMVAAIYAARAARMSRSEIACVVERVLRGTFFRAKVDPS